ncbi:MAG TPA: response regulator [Beijerinckiaceae bacterium]|jgi:PAS domain S-box-containing protein
MTEQLRPSALAPRPEDALAVGTDLLTVKVLAVDDDRRNLLAVQEMLRGPGIEVVVAESGEEALRQVLLHDFAVILLDVQMPRIDGYEVASMVRGRQRSSRVPIIFLTAFNKDELHVFRGYSAGAVDYVFKPIEPLILRSKVEIFVDLFRKTEEIRRQAAEERRLLMENLRVRGEKLRAEQSLRRRDEHQSLVLKALPIALYTASAREDHRRLQFTNESVKAITGYAPKDFADTLDFWEARLNPDDHDRVMATLSGIGESGSVTLEYRWRCADGSERNILDQCVLIRDDEGRRREYFGLWFDITERKELEQSLLHASKLEAVGRLTGGIAHDFNNMLSVVIGNLDLLQNTVQNDERALRRVRFAIEGAQRCADLTNRLLAFSRRQPLQTSRVDLNDLVPTMLELLQRTLGERIDVQLEADPDLWPIEVDTTQLESAIVNLAVNARDAMPDGGKLTIAMANAPAGTAAGRGGGVDGDAVVIAVSDTGTGMAPDVLERVFEPFFTTKESGKGTGLGLSMVYGFVSQSKGDIAVDSQPGEGTTIRLILPRAETAAQPARLRAVEAAAPRGDGETILVVEDDAKVRQVAVSTLAALGFTVREAENGDEAVEALRHDGGVDLVLSDVRMPGSLTGGALARRIRQDWPDTRILLTSGYVEADEDIGEFDIIYKPYRLSELAERVHAALHGAGGRDDARQRAAAE